MRKQIRRKNQKVHFRDKLKNSNATPDSTAGRRQTHSHQISIENQNARLFSRILKLYSMSSQFLAFFISFGIIHAVGDFFPSISHQNLPHNMPCDSIVITLLPFKAQPISHFHPHSCQPSRQSLANIELLICCSCGVKKLLRKLQR